MRFTQLGSSRYPNLFRMKTFLLPLLVLVAAFVGGCVSQDTAKLRVGMPKDEVLKIMGKPDSAGADGTSEYLNYRLTSTRSSGGSTYFSPSGGVYSSSHTFSSTEPFIVKLQDGLVVAYGNSSQVGANRSATTRYATPASFTPAAFKVISQSAGAEVNGVRILAVEPKGAAVGRTTEFKVRIAYSLKEASDGRIEINFNTLGAHAFHIYGAQIVSTGSGELEAVVKVTPKDWGQLTPFCAQAVLVSSPIPHEGKPLSVSKREISLTQ